MYHTVIIGAGLSGIKQFINAYKKNLDNLLMIDFEEEMGTLINDVGTESERAMLEHAHRLPYEFWGQTTATDLDRKDDRYLITVETVAGKEVIETKNITIATGATEQTREENAISGLQPTYEMTPTLAFHLLKRGNIPGLKPFIILNSDRARAVAKKLYNYPKCRVIIGEDVDILSVHAKSCLQNVHIWNRKYNREQKISCDALIYSDSTIANINFLKRLLIKQDEYGFIHTNSSGETSLPGVYAFGDCVSQ